MFNYTFVILLFVYMFYETGIWFVIIFVKHDLAFCVKLSLDEV